MAGSTIGGPPVWRAVLRIVGAALAAASVVLLVLPVRLDAAPGRSLSCGSPFDVIAGRADWRQWRVEDLGDAGGGLPRTARCPGAVNDRTAAAGGTAIAATSLLVAALRPRRRKSATRDSRRPDPAAGNARRLRRLGVAAVTAGAALTAAGLVGLVVLVANPSATLFLYVRRPVALLIGLALLAPAVALLVVGRALTLRWSDSQPPPPGRGSEP